jgi:hypothetical protein
MILSWIIPIFPDKDNPPQPCQPVRAILTYMRAKKAKEIDDNLIATLGPHADEIFQESLPMMESQVWPPDDDLVEEHPVPAPRRRRTAVR